ncbi:MAG: hypothetical protein R2838_20270 [Caldilineaceae bacterium]
MSDERAPARTSGREPSRRPSRPGWDAFLLALLVLAHLQVLGLAESAALPLRLQDVLRHPVLGRLIPPAGVAAFGEVGPRPGEPVGLVLFALTVGGVLLYFVADLALRARRKQQVKWALLRADHRHGAGAAHGASSSLLRQGAAPPASPTTAARDPDRRRPSAFCWKGAIPTWKTTPRRPWPRWGFSEYRTALLPLSVSALDLLSSARRSTWRQRSASTTSA